MTDLALDPIVSHTSLCSVAFRALGAGPRRNRLPSLMRQYLGHLFGLRGASSATGSAQSLPGKRYVCCFSLEHLFEGQGQGHHRVRCSSRALCFVLFREAHYQQGRHTAWPTGKEQ